MVSSRTVADRPVRERPAARAPLDLEGEDLGWLIQSLEDEMWEAAKELRFEYAARLRDEAADLRKETESLAEITS